MRHTWPATVNTTEPKHCTNNMFTTEFLTKPDHYRYGDWLRSQDDDTRYLYFGVTGGTGLIERLIERIEAEPDQHEILVAQNSNDWVGTLHVAKISTSQVEFGIIVDRDHRGQGIGNALLEEAIVWARNRNYTELFMHCLGWNKPIQHLCHKHGLLPHSILGDNEVNIRLNPPSWATIASEVGIRQRNVYHAFLQNSKFLYQEIYG